MVVVHALGFAIGLLLGAVVAVAVFAASLWRGARAFHAHGVVCRAEVSALDPVIGARLAGPARVRLSGATGQPGGGPDILGVAIQWPPESGPAQDFLCGSFESFARAAQARRDTRVDDFFANRYHGVARWQVRGLGVVPLSLRAAASPREVSDGLSRRERLAADIGAGRAVFVLEAAGVRPLAEIRLVEMLATDGRDLRLSMFRAGRGLVPTGLLSGIRALAYPASQLGRRLRGG